MAVKNVIFRLQAETGALRKELDEIKKSMTGIGSSVDNVEKEFQGLTGTIKKVGLALGGLAIGQQLVGFGKSAIQSAADFESLQISFTTFLGSADKANEVLAELQEFSALTPFTGEQVQTAGKALLAFGVEADDLQESLRKVGDISAGTGKDFNELAVIFGKAKVQGTLFAEDINQLTEAGVPVIQEFAKQLGVSESEVKKLGSEGKINFGNLEKAFTSLTGEGGKFFNLTESLSQSTTGRLSTLEDNWDQLKRTIGEGLLPVVEVFLEAGNRTIEFLRNLPTFIEENKNSIIAFGAAIGILVGYLTRQNQIQIVNSAIKLKDNIVERVSSAIQRQKAAAVALNTKVTQRATIAQKAGTLATAAGTSAFRLFNTAIKANPIGLLVSGLSLLAGAFFDFGDGIEETNESLEDAEDGLFGFESASQSVNKVTEETNKRVAEEAAGFKVLLNELKNTNAGSEERSQLINKINSQYGTTLKNLKDETAFIQQLDQAYKDYLSTLKQRIFQEVKSEEITRLVTKQIELEEKIAKETRKLQKEALPKGTIVAGRPIEVDEKGIETLGSIRRRLTLEAKELDKAEASLFDVENALDGLANSFNKFQDADPLGTGKTGGTAPAPKVKATADKIKSILEDLKKELDSVNQDITKQNAELIDADNFEAQIERIKKIAAAENSALEAKIAQRKKEATDKNEDDEEAVLFDAILKQQLLLNEQKLQSEISKIQKQAAEERRKTQFELDKTEQDIEFFETELDDFRTLNENKEALNSELNQAASEEEKKLIQEKIDGVNEILKKSLENQLEFQIKRIEDERDFQLISSGLSGNDLTENQQLERQLIIRQADLEILKQRQDFNDQIEDLDSEVTDKTKEQQKERTEAIKEGIREVLEATADLVNKLLEAQIAITDNQISQQQKRVDQAKEIAENGNAALLAAEEDRLNKLNKQREKFVRAQQALAAIELVANSIVAISKAAAQGGAAAPFTIAATLIALASGLIAAKAQAQSAASGFASGGYTGDGGKYQPAGTVHKGEFVFNKETTSRFRPLFEDLHKGRNPFLTEGLSERVIVVNNFGFDEKLERIEKAIQNQDRLKLVIDERGVSGIVTRIQAKDKRIRNKVS